MPNRSHTLSLAILSVLILSVLAACDLRSTEPASSTPWDQVRLALEEMNKAPAQVPAEAMQDGPPVQQKHRVLFRFKADQENVKRVHLAGNFNSWALNYDGEVLNDLSVMQQAGDGRWERGAEL